MSAKRKTKQLEAHESGVRRLVEGDTYKSFKSLEEAQQAKFAAVVFEGDWGGTIFATCPISEVHCSESHLRDLVEMIDSVYWDQPEGARVYFEACKIGDDIAGGMGGGTVTNGVWIHPKIVALGFRPIIEGVLKSENPIELLTNRPLSRSELRARFTDLFKFEGWGINILKSEGACIVQMGDHWGRTFETRAATEKGALNKALRMAKRIQAEIIAANRHSSLVQ